MRFYSFLESRYPPNHKFIGVEIGVYEGEGAKLLCKSLDFETLHLVDPYLKYAEYTSYGGHSQEYWNEMYERVRTLFSMDENNVGRCEGSQLHLHKMTSEQVVKKFDDNSVDFVYIDGNHAYDYVKLDIELWYEKIKRGGWVTGHDWPYPGVQKAAQEFIANKGLTFGDKSHMKGYTEWWFQKA